MTNLSSNISFMPNLPQFDEEKPTRKLDILRRKDEEESVALIAGRYGIPYIDLSVFPVEVDAIKLLPEDKSRRGQIVIFSATGSSIKVAVRNPRQEETLAILKRLEQDRFTIETYIASAHSIEHALSFYQKVPKEELHTAGRIQVADAQIAALQKEFTDLPGIKKRVEQAFFVKTTEVLEIILAGALASEASDVHIEPQEAGARVRFRLDGVLHDISTLPPKLYAQLLSRIKLISELKLNIHDRAQDGRFTIRTPQQAAPASNGQAQDGQSTDTEVRTSTLPGPAGENIVMRILSPEAIAVRFEALGMQPWVTQTLAKELERPNGMILTTGPTGSGKTTTLYTFIKKTYTPEIKIITIEDPIEYRISGIEQTQVDTEKGYDFANGLRAIVRQDPDVILVGEIRDLDTAETAMNAALTGHLVFSTLHTNNAAGAIPRLITLGVRPESIAPALNVAMGQRLVRKLCDACRVVVPIEGAIKERIVKELAKFPAGIAPPQQDVWTVYQASASGCASCSQMGYKGRIGVYEIILVDDGIEALVLKGAPSELQMKKEAERQGQITMYQDGLLKILSGQTDFGEVQRIIGVAYS